MAEKPCVVSINNTNYYYPCDYSDYLVVMDNSLINIGSQSINLYHDFIIYGDNTSGYPRITCPTNTKAYIRQSYSSSNYQILNVQSFEFINRNISNNILLMVIIVGVLICQLFKR